MCANFLKHHSAKSISVTALIQPGTELENLKKQKKQFEALENHFIHNILLLLAGLLCNGPTYFSILVEKRNNKIRF